MSYHDRLEQSFILSIRGDVLLEHPGWISDVSPEGVVLLEGEELGTASLYHIASEACYPLPQEVAGKRVFWHPCVAPAGGKCVGYCVAPGGRGIVNNYSPEGQSITDSFAVDLMANMLFEPLPLFLRPYDTGQETIAQNRLRRAARVNDKGETTFTYPAGWRYAGYWPIEGKEGEYEIRLQAAHDKGDDAPNFLAGFNMEWLRGPFEAVWALREGMRCVREVQRKPVYSTEDETQPYFVDAEWNRCLDAPRGYRFGSNGVRHGHISFYPVNNYCRQGLMDKAGNIIFKPRYSQMWHITGPYWWYRKKGGFGILHESGEELTPPSIGQAYSLWEGDADLGLVPAARKGTARQRNGIVNMQGEWVIEPKYGSVSAFCHPEYTTARNWKKS